MKVKELLNKKISYFTNKKFLKGWVITLLQFLKYESKVKLTIESMRLLSEDKYKKAKSELPCATLSCVCGNSKNEIAEANNVLVVDIDHIDNPEEVKQKVMTLPYVFLAQLSVSGKGVFALVYIESAEHYKEHYNALVDDFKSIGITIDQQCSNLNRLRYLSYDSNILIKGPEVDIVAYNKIKEIKKDIPTKVTEHKGDELYDLDEFVFKALYVLIVKHKYTVPKDGSGETYSNWLLDGFRLATLGEVGRLFFRVLSERSDGFTDMSDVDNKFNECMRTTRFDRSAMLYYFKLLKDIYGNKWVHEVSNFKDDDLFSETLV